jgi:hypothetical protein
MAVAFSHAVRENRQSQPADYPEHYYLGEKHRADMVNRHTHDTEQKKVKAAV